jgi:hypothetical protein
VHDSHSYEDSTELGMRLALRALSLVRSGADTEGAVVVLVGLASNNREAMGLARARCLAAADQGDAAAGPALALFDAALERF